MSDFDRRSDDRPRRSDSDRGHSGGRHHGGGRRFGGRPNFNRNQGPREMHKATCSECGKECEVPFKPTQGKPVYCRECFQKRRDS